MKNALILFAVVCIWASATSASNAEEKPGVQSTAQLNTQVKVQMGYLLYLPKDYDKQASWPLMLFLHGAGADG